jgi:hypothetical protein
MTSASLKDVQSTKYHIIAIQYSSCHLLAYLQWARISFSFRQMIENSLILNVFAFLIKFKLLTVP